MNDDASEGRMTDELNLARRHRYGRRYGDVTPRDTQGLWLIVVALVALMAGSVVGLKFISDRLDEVARLETGAFTQEQ